MRKQYCTFFLFVLGLRLHPHPDRVDSANPNLDSSPRGSCAPPRYTDGSRKPINGTFITNGTFPRGSMWAMLPIPEAGLGPRCLPGPNDTNSTPHGCQPWEGRNDGHNGHVPGPCVPCPETPGSDCSRCDNGGKDAKSPSFTPPFPGVQGSPQEGILDVVKVPADLPPGDYVLGWRCRSMRVGAWVKAISCCVCTWLSKRILVDE